MMQQKEILDKLGAYKREKQEQFALEGFGVFGSVAKDDHSDHSDVDVFVKLSKPDIYILGHIKSDLEEIFGLNVDVVRVRDQMNEFLKKQITGGGIYV